MTQPRKPSREIDIRKASAFAIIVNALQIGMLLAFVAYVVWADPGKGGLFMTRALAVVCAFTAGWGALLDIRQAILSRRNLRTIAHLEATVAQMDALNHTLRAQRHDFLSHLQVVYSLMEMGEYPDATDYLEKVYGDIRSVSSILRTHSTAVNALLKVKTAAAKEAGVAFQLDIKSTLEGAVMPGWELCCVLSNLLDNAIEAAQAAESPAVSLRISENLREYTFQVENNGQSIPPTLLKRVFEPGVTTMGEGHGMGLQIVRQTLEEYGGLVDCDSAAGQTVFTAVLPKQGT